MNMRKLFISMFFLLIVTSQYADEIERVGFYELEPVTYSLNFENNNKLEVQAGKARVWYSFFEANINPEKKPIFVFLNGGPGCATTTNLFSMNTAPYTLDKERIPKGEHSAKNPNSWTQVGNLLYIDAPNTGFSYNMVPNSDYAIVRAAQFSINNYNCFIDADQVLRVVLGFLDKNPRFTSNEVIFVGESYSGTRVSTLLNLLLFYEKYSDGSMIFTDKTLGKVIENHFAKTLPKDSSHQNIPPDVIADQFGRQILVQPQICDIYQDQISGQMFDEPNSIMVKLGNNKGINYLKFRAACPIHDSVACAFIFLERVCDLDKYNYSRNSSWSDDLEIFAMQALLNVKELSVILDYDITKITMLKPAARAAMAYRYISPFGQTEVEAIKKNYYDISGDNHINITDKDRLWLDEQEDVEQLQVSLREGSGSFKDVFGKLNYYDDYLVSTNTAIYLAFNYNVLFLSFPNYKKLLGPNDSTIYGRLFLENLVYVNTFMTDANLDLVIYSPAIPEMLKKYPDIVEDVTTKRGNDIEGGSRNGNIVIAYKKDFIHNLTAEPQSSLTRNIFWPHYAESGHSVSSTEPDIFLLDVKDWLNTKTNEELYQK